MDPIIERQIITSRREDGSDRLSDYFESAAVKACRQVFDYKITENLPQYGERQPKSGPHSVEECWIYSGPVALNGEPVVFDPITETEQYVISCLARDFMWTNEDDADGFFKVDSPTAQIVNRTCGNKACTNPLHLRISDTHVPSTGKVQLHKKVRQVIKFLVNQVDWATTEQVAEYYNISVAEVEKIAANGKIKAISKAYRFMDWDLWRAKFPGTTNKVKIKQITHNDDDSAINAIAASKETF